MWTEYRTQWTCYTWQSIIQQIGICVKNWLSWSKNRSNSILSKSSNYEQVSVKTDMQKRWVLLLRYLMQLGFFFTWNYFCVLCWRHKYQTPMSCKFGLFQIKLHSHMSLVELSLTGQHNSYNISKNQVTALRVRYTIN